MELVKDFALVGGLGAGWYMFRLVLNSTRRYYDRTGDSFGIIAVLGLAAVGALILGISTLERLRPAVDASAELTARLPAGLAVSQDGREITAAASAWHPTQSRVEYVPRWGWQLRLETSDGRQAWAGSPDPATTVRFLRGGREVRRLTIAP